MLKFYHIDAFTNQLFKGNSACVVVLEHQLSDDILLKIAKENGVAETAYLLQTDNGLSLRWFTPDLEMDLCGHATLAASYVVFNFYPELINNNALLFHTQEGIIKIEKEIDQLGRELFSLNFPIRVGKKAQLPQEIINALNIQPKEVYLSRDYHLVYESADEIAALKIDRLEFDKINLGQGGVVASAPGATRENECYINIGESDFVSRFFTPQATILEDPVTGSAHCTIAPYWADRLNKVELTAKQISERGGELFCSITKESVVIKGEAICFSQGEILTT